jgi:hypothetical protein
VVTKGLPVVVLGGIFKLEVHVVFHMFGSLIVLHFVVLLS